MDQVCSKSRFLEETMLKIVGQPRLLKLSFSLLAVLILVLAACGVSGASTATAPSPHVGRVPVRGGTWIDDLLEGPDSLLSHILLVSYIIHIWSRRAR